MAQNSKKALLVIDVQNDFCPGGALEVPDGDIIVPKINALFDSFEVKVFTQDWHPRKHSSFASSHKGMSPYEIVKLNYGDQVLWPNHCVQGSKGAEFHPNLMTDAADVILRKGFRQEIDSYSAFFENDHQTPTGLAGYLQIRGVTHIAFVGLATDYCVYYSAMDAIKLGYKVEVLEDCCGAIDINGSLSSARSDMKSAGVTLK